VAEAAAVAAVAAGRVQAAAVERLPRPAVRLPWPREPRLGRRLALAPLRDPRPARAPHHGQQPARVPQRGRQPVQRVPVHQPAN
jgi:hypothetical protein